MDNHLTFNDRIFEQINSEENSYWFGFLCADGCIHQGQYDYRIELGLCKQDYGHLVKYKNFIGKDNKISYRPKTKSYRYNFRDKKVHNDLIATGCTPAKSLTLEFPSYNIIPKRLMRHFIRGYFDGDGSIWYSNKTCGGSILGTKNFLLGLQKEVPCLSHYKIIPVHAERPDTAQRIGFMGKNMLDFLNFLYKNANVYLDRKYFRYKEFLCHLSR